MKNLKIRTDGKTVTAMKQLLLLISLIFMAVPAIVWGSGSNTAPAIRRILQAMFLSGIASGVVLALTQGLLSRYSPVKQLKIRKKLILFTRMFLHSKEDGLLLHSVQ